MRRSVLDMERLEHQLHILMEILNRQLDAHTWNSGRRYNIVVVSKAMKQVNILVVSEATDTQSSMKIVFTAKYSGYPYLFHSRRSATKETQRNQ